jgi:hypothetical protein
MTGQKPEASTSARHRTDAVSLIFGLLFLGVAGWWAAWYYLDWMITWRLPDAGWLVAGVLILLGLLGIMASLRRDRRDVAATPAAPHVTAPGVDPWPGAAPVLADPEPVQPVEPEPVWPVDPEPGSPVLADPEPVRPVLADSEPVRPDEPTAELDPPAASDPGGHRPE